MRVLDLFAGTGWGVALQKLGIEEYGVEIMPQAIATRELNGMHTVYNDAWESWRAESFDFDTLIASPPCQTFSLAGRGAGREALLDVVDLINRGAYKSVRDLRDAADEMGDERTGLVLIPLHYVVRFRPKFVAFEQVPTVLPVWEAYAVQMREMGYSVWVGYIHSEQYGVAQTRKRAYLIARNDGIEAGPPVPTHSQYYPRNVTKLDLGVEAWVSMYDALNWGITNRPSPTITGHGTVIRSPSGQQDIYMDAIRDGEFKFRPDLPDWTHDRPSTTIVGSFRPDIVAAPGYRVSISRQHAPDSVNITLADAGLLQSYPIGFEFVGSKSKQFLQVGNAVPPLVAEAVISTFL